jgi:hypothetical protein
MTKALFFTAARYTGLTKKVCAAALVMRLSGANKANTLPKRSSPVPTD